MHPGKQRISGGAKTHFCQNLCAAASSAGVSHVGRSQLTTGCQPDLHGRNCLPDSAASEQPKRLVASVTTTVKFCNRSPAGIDHSVGTVATPKRLCPDNTDHRVCCRYGFPLASSGAGQFTGHSEFTGGGAAIAAAHSS